MLPERLAHQMGSTIQDQVRRSAPDVMRVEVKYIATSLIKVVQDGMEMYQKYTNFRPWLVRVSVAHVGLKATTNHGKRSIPEQIDMIGL